MCDCAQQALRWASPSVRDDVILQPVGAGLDWTQAAGAWQHIMHERAAYGAGLPAVAELQPRCSAGGLLALQLPGATQALAAVLVWV